MIFTGGYFNTEVRNRDAAMKSLTYLFSHKHLKHFNFSFAIFSGGYINIEVRNREAAIQTIMLHLKNFHKSQ